MRYGSNLKRIMGYTIPFIGIFLVLACAALIWWWEADGRERYFYQDVIVLKEDAKRGQVIDEKMLARLKVESTKKIANAISDPELVLNKAAKHYIPKYSQLDPQYFDNKDVVAVGDKKVTKIPSDWIYSIPNTIRKNDTVFFYEVSKDVLNLENKKIQIDANKNTSLTSDGKKEDVSISLYMKENEDTLKGAVKEAVIKSVVAYVKDSANREVVSTSPVDRIDGSSSVKDIEVVITAEELKKLENSVKNGNKFVLMYTEGKDDNETKPAQ